MANALELASLDLIPERFEENGKEDAMNIKIRQESRTRLAIRRFGRFLESDAALYFTIAVGICAAAWAVYCRFIEPCL